jgi:hypothetical protein
VNGEEYRRKRAAQRRAQRRAAAQLAITGDEGWHGTTSGYSNHCCRCDECRRAQRDYSNEWRTKPGTPERLRALGSAAAKAPHRLLARRARIYGLTPTELTAMMASGVCDACGTDDHGGRAWAVDHDHACCPGQGSCGRCVRGILCQSCNTALGMVDDSEARLLELAQYIKRWRDASQQA